MISFSNSSTKSYFYIRYAQSSPGLLIQNIWHKDLNLEMNSIQTLRKEVMRSKDLQTFGVSIAQIRPSPW